MADFFVLLNSGDYVLLNDGTSRVLLNSSTEVVVAEGGSSGGKVKSVGHELTDLGPRPHTIQNGESKSKVLIRPVNYSKGKIVLRLRGESVYTWFGGVSTSTVLFPLKSESHSKLFFITTAKSHGMLHPSAFMERIVKDTKALGRAVKALSYITMLESLDTVYPSPKTLEFSFSETNHNEQLIAFTHSSSWIGNVRYDTEAKTMRILMNGKAFNHCGVEQIDYDKFEGAPSKGEHWWREIKDRFNC